MFKMILHANDGSEHAFKALHLAIETATRDGAALHMICVEEIPAMPEYIEEIREARATAGRRFRGVIQRSRSLAEQRGLPLEVHACAGHPVRTIVDLAHRLPADLLVIGAVGHSAFYERMIGSRADRIVQLAPCPVLVVK